jgi:hypothetical protein
VNSERYPALQIAIMSGNQLKKKGGQMPALPFNMLKV